MDAATTFRPGDRARATKGVDTTVYGTVGEERSDGDVLVHWDRGGYAVVEPSRLERVESEPGRRTGWSRTLDQADEATAAGGDAWARERGLSD